MSNWPIQQGPPRIRSATFVTAGSVEGVQLTLPGAAHTPGAWTQLNASMAACEGMLIQVQVTSDSDLRYFFSIGVGSPGAQVPLIENIAVQTVNYRNHGCTVFLPLRVPAGTTLWARYQVSDPAFVSSGGGFPILNVQPVGPSALFPVGFSRCDTYGANLATTSGTSIPVAYADGAPITEIIASTTRVCRAIGMSFSGGTAPSAGFLSLFTGSSMTERWVDRLWITGGFPAFIPFIHPVLPVHLPAGSRVGGRLTLLNNSSFTGTILHLYS